MYIIALFTLQEFKNKHVQLKQQGDVQIQAWHLLAINLPASAGDDWQKCT